ncbi:MAG: hypothetical protein IT578_04105 [Verrucomicrobiae bacterium]|nr:hypothetical protein [Verrucomicrobiae bacterium]
MPRRRPPKPAPVRYVLRFCGDGPAPRADIALIEGEREIRVMDFSPPRLMLVRARESRLRAVLRRLPGWAMSAERAVPLPARPARRPKVSP